MPGAPPQAGEAAGALERAVLGRVARGALDLPPYPAVAARVRSAVAGPGAGLAEVAQLLGADAALAAAAFRVAGSATYGAVPVTSLAQAITRIGAHQVLRLVVASGLAAWATAPGPLAPLRRRTWISGLAAARVCEALARSRGQREDEAFTAGLLRDVGEIAAAAALERVAAEGAAPAAVAPGAWAEAVRRLRAPLGVEVAARWALPLLVRQAIAAHAAGPGAPCDDPGLLEVVRAADAVVALLLAGPGVSAADLAAALPEVAPGEREPIVRVLEELPAFVAAFEPAAPDWADGPAFLERPGASGLRPVRFEALLRTGGRVARCEAEAISADRLVVRAPGPLAEDRLVEVTVGGPGGFTVWMMSGACQADGASHRVELQPFGLSSGARQRWEALVAAAASRGELA